MAEKPWEVTINRQVPAMSSDRAVNEALTATQLQRRFRTKQPRWYKPFTSNECCRISKSCPSAL